MSEQVSYYQQPEELPFTTSIQGNSMPRPQKSDTGTTHSAQNQWIYEQRGSIITAKIWNTPYTSVETSSHTSVPKTYDAEQKKRERLYGIADFRLRYGPETARQDILNDITSYLGEYRLQVQKYDFDQYYTHGQDGELKLRAKPSDISMTEIGEHAIKDRNARRLSTYKESADLMGIKKIESLVALAKQGDTILYASPPDPKVGFGYGFVYIGDVEVTNTQEKVLHMTAIRIDNKPTLDQFNSAFSMLTQQEVKHKEPNDFIRGIHLLKRTVHPSEVDFVLQGNFDFTPDANAQLRMQTVMRRLKPYKTHFTDSVLSGVSGEEQEEEFFNLENLTIQFAKEYDADIKNGKVGVFRGESKVSRQEYHRSVRENSHRPPPVSGGSCPENQMTQSPDMYGIGSTFGSPTMVVSYSPMGVTQSGVECKPIVCPACGWKPIGAQLNQVGITIKSCPQEIEDKKTGKKKLCGYTPK